MDIEKKLEQVATAFEDFKKLNDKALGEAKKLGEETAETKAQVTKANEEITKLQNEAKAMQATLARAHRGDDGGGDKTMSPEKAAYKAALHSYMRGAISDSEMKQAHGVAMAAKALGSTPNEDGGFLIMPEMSAEIVKKVFESSPIRQLASSQAISGNTLEILQDLSEPGSGWTGERSARPATSTPVFDKIIIPTHELYAFPMATQNFLDDAMINVEAWLADHVAAKFSRDEESAFVNGDGVARPKGLLTYANGTTLPNTVQQVNSGSATTLTTDGLIDLLAQLKGAYKINASFLMNRLTVPVIRKFKDSQGQYLWQPGLAAGNPDLLLGKAIYEAEDMPVVGANALSVIVGDLKQAYQIVDRFGIRTLRDPFTNKPFVGFYTTKRVGGGTKNFEAYKIQKCAV